jgi:hypothetical protein
MMMLSLMRLRMDVRCLRRLALVMVWPGVLTAQSTLHRGAITASAGVGTGSGALSCDLCASDRAAGLSWLARLGVGVRDNLAISAEANGWASDYTDSHGSGTARMVFVNVVAQWYPTRASGLFVKAGGGVASIRDEITINQVGRATVTAHSPALVVGAGWDVPLAHRWAVTPYADFSYAAKGDQTVNGLHGSGELGGSVVHAGVALSVR